MFKVNDKTHQNEAFIGNFEHITHLFLAFLQLIVNK